MSKMICLRRIQDLDGVDDLHCVKCWQEKKYPYGEGGGGYYLRYYYADRDECYEENVVSEEEFDVIEKRRCERERAVSSRGR